MQQYQPVFALASIVRHARVKLFQRRALLYNILAHLFPCHKKEVGTRSFPQFIYIMIHDTRFLSHEMYTAHSEAG